MQVSFQGNPKKIIERVLNSRKTIRDLKREDVASTLKYIGFSLDRTMGDHFTYTNNNDKVFSYSVKPNGVVDPKVAKQLKELLQKLGFKKK